MKHNINENICPRSQPTQYGKNTNILLAHTQKETEKQTIKTVSHSQTGPRQTQVTVSNQAVSSLEQQMLFS